MDLTDSNVSNCVTDFGVSSGGLKREIKEKASEKKSHRAVHTRDCITGGQETRPIIGIGTSLRIGRSAGDGDIKLLILYPRGSLGTVPRDVDIRTV